MISTTDSVSIAVPSFIAKLWDIVNNGSFQDIICWSESKSSLIIKNKEKLCTQVLPLYFKHSNLSSFIRQLNKYGFKKANCFGNHNDLEYAHNHFLADDPLALVNIEKKVSSKSEYQDCEDTNIKDLFDKVQNLKKSQEEFEVKLNDFGDDSKELWDKTMELKKKQRVQQKIICNIMAFLADIISQNDNDMDNISLLFSKNVKKGKNNMIGVCEMPLMIKSKGDSDFPLSKRNTNATKNINEPSTTGHFIEEVDPVSSSLINSLLSENGTISTNIADDTIDENMSTSISDEDSSGSSLPDITDLHKNDQQIVQPIVNSQITDNLLFENTPLSKVITGMKLNASPKNYVINLEENNSLLNADSLIHVANLDNNKNGSNSDCIQIPDNKPSAVNDLPGKIPDIGEGALLQEYMPSDVQTKELGDHVNSMDSHLNSLKELMSDSGLNLDINEVQELFSPEELAFFGTSTVDPIIATDNLVEQYPYQLPPDPILDAAGLLRSPTRVDKFS